MKRFMIILVLVVSFVWFIWRDVFARPISGCSEALTAGNSFLNEVIERFGSWGGDTNPYIKSCQEFTDNKGRVVGYFLPIMPKGYIMLNALTQLSPVMAYSETSDLNLSSQRGMAQLLRDYMGDRRDYLERKYGKLENVPEFGVAPDSNLEMWDYYLKKGPAPKRDSNIVVGPLLRTRWDAKVASLGETDTLHYGPGLGNISWHQEAPFNNSCPLGYNNQRTVVGCVATAAAQIMKYWNYPKSGIGSHSYTWDGDDSCSGGSTPGGTLSAAFSDTYDWTNMLDDYSGGYNSTQAAAVAELCYEVGVAFNMDYGVCGSSASTSDAATVLPTYFKYADTTDVLHRASYTPAQWFALIRKEFDNPLPRPIQYRIYKSGWGGHSVVCDGYNTSSNLIHINYGWDDSHTAWYSLDNLYCGGGDPCPANDQYMVVGIQPINKVYVGSKASSGTTLYYGGSFPSSMSWGLMGGESTHAPAMAVFNNRQYIAVKASSGNSIYMKSKNGMANWSSWTLIPGQTDVSPVLVVYNNRLYLFAKGLDNNIYYKSMNSAETWTSWQAVPGWSSSDHPAAAVLGDYLWLFAKGSGSNNSIYYRSFDGSTWGTTYTLSGSTNVAPAVVTHHPTGNLMVFVRGLDGAVYYRETTSPPTNWSSWYSLGGSTPTTPSVAMRSDNETLYLAVRGGNSGIYYKHLEPQLIPLPDPPGGYMKIWNWSSSWSSVPGSTSDTPVLNTYYFYDP